MTKASCWTGFCPFRRGPEGLPFILLSRILRPRSGAAKRSKRSFGQCFEHKQVFRKTCGTTNRAAVLDCGWKSQGSALSVIERAIYISLL